MRARIFFNAQQVARSYSKSAHGQPWEQKLSRGSFWESSSRTFFCASFKNFFWESSSGAPSENPTEVPEPSCGSFWSSLGKPQEVIFEYPLEVPCGNPSIVPLPGFLSLKVLGIRCEVSPELLNKNLPGDVYCSRNAPRDPGEIPGANSWITLLGRTPCLEEFLKERFSEGKLHRRHS